jgi:predicted DNA-binding transcriptional regulator AlpA
VSYFQRKEGRMNQTNDKLTCSIKEFAALSGISAATAYDLAKRNKLPVKVLRIGEKRMFLSRREVYDYLNGQKKDN